MNHMATCAAVALLGASANAVTNPFTEAFAAGASGWRNADASAALAYSAFGSFNGSSFVSGGFNFASSITGDTPVILRGQDEFGFSGGAFEGDWLAAGVTEFTAFVRHDAPVPLTFFARFSGPANFPGAVGISFIPVAPNTWTPINIPISALAPNFVSFEGTDFPTVFSANPANSFQGIGHIQIGVDVPAALEGVDQPFTFDLDNPTITPSPGAVGLLAMGGLVAMRRRRTA